MLIQLQHQLKFYTEFFLVPLLWVVCVFSHWRTSIWSSMGKFIFFYSTRLYFESQNNILKTMILFFVKSTVFFSVVLIFCRPQTAHAITSENLFQLADSRITQLLATHCDCSKQNSPRQFSWTRVQRLTQVPSEIKYTRGFAAVFVHAKAKRIKTFCRYATIEETKVFCAEGALGKVERHDLVEWNTNCILLPKELDPMKRENVIQKFDKAHGAELKQYSYNGSFNSFGRLSFLVHFEKK